MCPSFFKDSTDVKYNVYWIKHYNIMLVIQLLFETQKSFSFMYISARNFDQNLKKNN